MPEEEYLKGLFTDHFVLFLPKDIVSGDFYYAVQNERYACVAAGDCTGHGVPGALLSILGICFLNEVMQIKSELRANRILNMMREKVMKALHQTDSSTETKDSMDVSLCVLDNENNTLQYAGANRPMLFMRNGKISELKPDKMTIGLAPLKERPFTNNSVEIKPGDTFYLFSDGFSDQFGGGNDKKFKYKNFKRIIESVEGLPMARQKEYLESAFEEWKGKEQQVDDVMIFGFQI
jgi:serine phosphatase RsbU (regulator of sigma subunit)